MSCQKGGKNPKKPIIMPGCRRLDTEIWEGTNARDQAKGLENNQEGHLGGSGTLEGKERRKVLKEDPQGTKKKNKRPTRAARDEKKKATKKDIEGLVKIKKKKRSTTLTPWATQAWSTGAKKSVGGGGTNRIRNPFSKGTRQEA